MSDNVAREPINKKVDSSCACCRSHLSSNRTPQIDVTAAPVSWDKRFGSAAAEFTMERLRAFSVTDGISKSALQHLQRD